MTSPPTPSDQLGSYPVGAPTIEGGDDRGAPRNRAGWQGEPWE